jgi:hypothetical protein
MDGSLQRSRFRSTCMVADYKFPLVPFATLKGACWPKKKHHPAVSFQHAADCTYPVDQQGNLPNTHTDKHSVAMTIAWNHRRLTWEEPTLGCQDGAKAGLSSDAQEKMNPFAPTEALSEPQIQLTRPLSKRVARLVGGVSPLNALNSRSQQ